MKTEETKAPTGKDYPHVVGGYGAGPEVETTGYDGTKNTKVNHLGINCSCKMPLHDHQIP